MTKQHTDQVTRAMTNDGQFRVIVATMLASCSEAADQQDADLDLLNRQAELMVAAVLVRETMQPGNRVQIILKDPRGHRLVADALPDGQNRGIINPGNSEQAKEQAPESNSALNAKSGLMQVNYTLRNGDLHQGIVPLDEGAAVGSAVVHYLMQSEQITAIVCIASLIDEDEGGLKAVGGYVVQMTPETEYLGLQAMVSHLESFEDIGDWLCAGSDPKVLIGEILEQRDYAILAESPLRFGCTCSTERMILGLSTLPSADIGELISSGDIEVSCDACGRSYVITTDQLAEAFVAGGKGRSSN